eukprot:351655-Chlamydomonas_euryale.AAC.4
MQDALPLLSERPSLIGDRSGSRAATSGADCPGVSPMKKTMWLGCCMRVQREERKAVHMQVGEPATCCCSMHVTGLLHA